jgi:hypothetical protein
MNAWSSKAISFRRGLDFGPKKGHCHVTIFARDRAKPDGIPNRRGGISRKSLIGTKAPGRARAGRKKQQSNPAIRAIDALIVFRFAFQRKQ